MPTDHPLPGEVWRLPNIPSVTTSGEGGLAVIVDVRDGSVILYSRTARRLLVPLRSFLLTWHFSREACDPEQCSVIPCANPAWFSQESNNQFFPVCWAHLVPNRETRIIEPAEENLITGRCPACDAPSRFPGSGVSQSDKFEIHSCGRCRRDWVLIYPSEDTPEACVLLAELIGEVARILEDRGFVARIRLGIIALEMVRRAVGALGEPPHLAGVPITVTEIPRGPQAVYVIGYQPREVQRGIQRLGGQPDRTATFTAANLEEAPEPSNEKPYTNARTVTRSQAKDPVVGATWWHKQMFEQAHIVEIGSRITHEVKEFFVKFRTQGSPDVLTLDEFLAQYQDKPPAPPCIVGEEWIDTKGNTVYIKSVEETAAIVEATTGLTYLLPYAHFHKWRRVSRKSVYERLVDDPDDPV